MRLKYALGLACCAAMAGLAGAQSGTTLPRTQPKPIQPTPIQPAPTGKATPAQVNNLYPPALYQMNDVGKSLKLSQDQMNRLNTITTKIQDQYRDQYGKVGALNEADRFARLQELNQLYSTDWNKAAADIFTEQQRPRYQQLNHQYNGFNSLYDPAVQKNLNLTPEQLRGLRAQVDWSNQQMNTINGLGATDATKAAQQFNDYWKQRQQRIDKMLTPDQQKAWQQIIGEPFTFQPTFNPPR